jgi:predicted ATPase
LLSALTPRNLLSFGPNTPAFELENLNVLIGPNGSGKSNVLDLISLLRSTANDLPDFLSRTGGGEWIWKGLPEEPATIEVHVARPGKGEVLRHFLAFVKAKFGVELEEEIIEPVSSGKHKPRMNYHRFKSVKPLAVTASGRRRFLKQEDIESNLSILAQLRDAEEFPEITYLADAYKRIRLYRYWVLGRNTTFRAPQKADLRNDRLEEDFSNLGLFLNRFSRQPKTKDTLVAALRDLYEGLTDFEVVIEGGAVQVFFREGDFSIPATRLSDGSMRYLCLLAILSDPSPPPLIGIEEPEIGLHPDLLPKVADLLVEASRRTQLVVTTHSDILVDALTGHPSAVVVCEKVEGQSTMRRLDPAALETWLKKYRLGALWTRGELGGNRW